MIGYYQVTDDMNKQWFAVITDDLGVLSARQTGTWQTDSMFGPEDLIMPEQEHAFNHKADLNLIRAAKIRST
jgi:hypothetical protein